METLIGDLNRKIWDFSKKDFYFFYFLFLKIIEKNTYSERKERERVCVCVKFGHCKLDEKGRVHEVSFQGISSITSTRIIKKGALDYFLHQGLEDSLGAHTSFIQELDNRQEDCDLEFIKTFRFEECGIRATRINSKSLSMKLSRIDICYMMILIIYECCDYINFLYD